MKKKEVFTDLPVISEENIGNGECLGCAEVYIENRAAGKRGIVFDARSDEYVIVDHGHFKAAYGYDEIRSAA